MSSLTASIAASWSARLLERKGRLELGHPVAVLGRVGEARLAGALGVDVEQLLRQVDDGVFHPLLALVPGRRADLRQRRRRLAAADVLLNQVDLGDRHVQLGLLGEFEEQRLLGVVVRFVDELEAQIAGDAVIDVDDQVAFVQVEKTVDRPRLVPPSSSSCGGRRRGRTARGRRSPAWRRRPCGSRPGCGRRSDRAGRHRASSVSAKTSPSRSTSAALWQAMRTRSPAAAVSSSSLTFVSSPENRSTLSIRRWQVASSESRREDRKRDRRSSDQPLERALDGVKPARVFDAGQVVPPFLAEVGRLQERDPGSLGEGVGGGAEAVEVVDA